MLSYLLYAETILSSSVQTELGYTGVMWWFISDYSFINGSMYSFKSSAYPICCCAFDDVKKETELRVLNCNNDLGSPVTFTVLPKCSALPDVHERCVPTWQHTVWKWFERAKPNALVPLCMSRTDTADSHVHESSTCQQIPLCEKGEKITIPAYICPLSHLNTKQWN